jgi:DNA-binding beta-propeller fold protein YncE
MQARKDGCGYPGHAIVVLLTLGLFWFTGPLDAEPRVITGLSARAALVGVPPPSPFAAAIVDPATLSKLPNLAASGVSGVGRIAVDLHGHQAFLGGYALVSSIVVVDATTNAVQAVVGVAPAGVLLTSLVADPVRARLYITTNSPQPAITVLDTRSMSFLPPIVLPPGPLGATTSQPVVAPDGTRLFVSLANTVYSVTLPDGQITGSATFAFSPGVLGLNQERNELYSADCNGDTIYTISADALSLERSFGGFPGVCNFAVRPMDGALLVDFLLGDAQSTYFLQSQLAALDPATGNVLETSTGTGLSLSVSIDGKQVYRLRRDDPVLGTPYGNTSSQLIVLDAATLGELASIPLDDRPPGPDRDQSAILATGAASIPTVSTAIEYFDASLGHYFTTPIPAEIAALDGGTFPGWVRTGETLPVYAQQGDGPGSTTPVCRFYGLPQKGLNSHFYSASPAECAAVQQKFGDSWLLESWDVLDVYLADASTGVCPFETLPVYRVYNNRPDANHRYTTSMSIRDSMVQAGWVPEGYGPDAVAFCVPR